jgi:hypothetical protein
MDFVNEVDKKMNDELFILLKYDKCIRIVKMELLITEAKRPSENVRKQRIFSCVLK